MNREPVGIRSIAVSFPREVRTNDYYRERYPEIVAKAEGNSLSRIFDANTDSSPRSRRFDEEMSSFGNDPFRGTVERRVLAPGERAIDLELQATREAIAAARLEPPDIGLVICGSFLPDQHGVGNATFLARELGLTGSAWNIESTCSTALVALQSAVALVRAGEYENILVSISCTYSRVSDDSDSVSWFLGDGAGAFVVGRMPPGQGVLSVYSVHSAETCGAFRYDLDVDEARRAHVTLRAGKDAGRLIRESNQAQLERCCERAAAAAGVALGDIRCFLFNTPTAWASKFAVRTLGIAPERTIDLYPRFANIGPALAPANLYYAARSGKIEEGDLVLVYTVGSVSSVGAAVMRWGRVGLGADPCA